MVFIFLAYFTLYNGLQFHPQTLLKAEVGDHEPAGRKRALGSIPFKISTNV